MSANSQLTTAVHALCWLELARRRGEPALSSDRIAASLASHPVLVRRSLAPLRDAGLVTVGRGPGAGWSLSRTAEKITIGDVHTALGEPAVFALHPHEPNLACPVGYGIRPVLAQTYDEVEAAITSVLTARTVADVLDDVLTDHPLPT